MDEPERSPDDSTAIEAMLNEGGRIQTGNLRRAAAARDASRGPGPQGLMPPYPPRSEGEAHV